MRELSLEKIKWVSLTDPDTKEVGDLGKKFPSIHPLILEDLLTPTIRPRIEEYDHHLYMVLHLPVFDAKNNRILSHEIDVILLKDEVVTVQYEHIPELEEIWREYEGGVEGTMRFRETPIHLLSYILRRLFAGLLKELDAIQAEIDTAEEEVFAGHEKEILEDISALKRKVLDFRKAVKPQHLMLESLVSHSALLYGKKTEPLVAGLTNIYHKLWDILENHKEALDALYETNASLLATKTNETMRVFTILAFITFIPTAIANIYGMNIDSLPLTDRGNAFWAVLGLMAFITGAVYLILKWRKLI